MRALPVLVFGESLAIVGLVCVWFARGGAASPVAAAPAPDRSVPAVAFEGAARTEGTVPGREAVTGGGASEAGAGDIVVHGRLLAADGGEAPRDAWVAFARAWAGRTGTSANDAYAVAGLSPGPWRVTVRADGFASYAADHTVGAASLQAIDLALERAARVKVFLRQPDGQPLANALRRGDLMRSLRVVVSQQGIDRDFSPSERAIVGDLDGGRYRSANDGTPGAADLSGADGELQLDRPAPLYAALLLRHVVVARAGLAPGQTELVLTVDPAEVLGKLATVRLRVLDPAGQPLEGVRVRFSSSSGGGTGAATDAQGVALTEGVSPGLASLQIQAKDRENHWTLLRVPAGGTLDAGDVVLHPASVIRGRVVDAQGRPVAGEINWTPLDTMTWPRELIRRRSTAADGDGDFEIPQAGRRRYVILATTADGRRGVGVAEGGSERPCTITVLPAVPVRVEVAGASRMRYVATLRDGGGVPVEALAIDARFRSTLRVPPGDYTLEVHDDTDRLVHSMKIAARGEPIDVEVR